jgi:hypothetical protein
MTLAIGSHTETPTAAPVPGNAASGQHFGLWCAQAVITALLKCVLMVVGLVVGVVVFVIWIVAKQLLSLGRGGSPAVGHGLGLGSLTGLLLPGSGESGGGSPLHPLSLARQLFDTLDRGARR